MTAAFPAAPSRSANKAWLRALELTAAIPRDPRRLLLSVIQQRAETEGDATAVISDKENWTYRELAAKATGYARWAAHEGFHKGDTVCLLMPNSAEYLAIWLGISSVGCVVALLNTNLSGRSLDHCIDVVAPARVICAPDLAGQLKHTRIPVSTASDLKVPTDSARTPDGEAVTIDDCALYIYTSGTTGLPKAARVSHNRLLQWSYWFAGLLDTSRADRMYNCLPMYHSVGGIVATGSVLVAGGSVALRNGFSVREFWPDIVRWNCTLFQYIGELCRYLVAAETQPYETAHQIRMCCGNGLSPDVWPKFKERFRIPHILEFYAATEGNFSLYNTDEKTGSIGRIPPFLSHRFPVELVRFDYESQMPVRDAEGFCQRCAVNEAGEAIGRVSTTASGHGGRFEGYTSAQATEKKLLRHAFEPGDTWFRTGDLMRKDEKGYFYFVDRVGDTFRWKGENVSTAEVAQAIGSFPGLRAITVYGVQIPHHDGRAGMAAISPDSEFDMAAFRRFLAEQLPVYARPQFLRVQTELNVTSTFKFLKTDLVREGYDPALVRDRLYFNDPESATFVPLDSEIYLRIQNGHIRV